MKSFNELDNDTLKYLECMSPEYRSITGVAAEVGSRIFNAGERERRPDMDKSECQPDELATDLARAIRYVIRNSRIDKDDFLFDCWAVWALKDYRIHASTSELLLKGERVSKKQLFEEQWCEYRRAFGVGVGNEKTFHIQLARFLKDRKFDPWKKTMETIAPISPDLFKDRFGFDPHLMCQFITGDDNEFTQKLWMYQFIGAVKRTIRPGCEHDHMLILVSTKKGLGKTRFLRAISRTPSETPESSNNYLQLRTLRNRKEDLERLRGRAIVNLDECDSAFRGLAADDLKEQITNTDDNYRKAFDIDAISYPRSCVLFGTTNTVELLQDMSGDRRFFPIAVKQALDIGWISNPENWKGFWGFYKWCYNQSTGDGSVYRNWLSDIERDLLEKSQSAYKAVAPWMETAESVLELLAAKHGGTICFSAADLLAELKSETGGNKAYMKDSLRDYLISECGYQEGRPKMSDGKAPSKAKLYKGASPKLLSRLDITEQYSSYLKGGHNRLQQPQVEAVPNLPPLVIEAPKALEAVADVEMMF